MNKTFKKIFSVCSAVVTTLTATLFHSTNLQAYVPKPKIVFAGPKASGKTKLVSGICNKYRYNSDYAATVFVNLEYTGQIQLWDTAGASMYIGVLPMYFGDTDLCVLHMSNTNQDIEDFLNILAETHVPKVVLCITKTDRSVPDSEKVRQLLGKIKQGLPDVNVFDEVLYTSAKENKFRFCTPDKYSASYEYQIYDTNTNEQVLAKKLYVLCGDKAENFRDNIYRQPVSSGNSGYKAHFQNGNSGPTYSFKSGNETPQDYLGQSSSTEKLTTSKAKKYAKDFQDDIYRQPVLFGDSGCEARFQNGTSKKDYSSESNSEYKTFHIDTCDSGTLQDYLEQSSFTEKPNPTTGKRHAPSLGIAAVLLTLTLGTGYYEYDRHFRKQEKTKTKTKSEQTPKVNRKISS